MCIPIWLQGTPPGLACRSCVLGSCHPSDTSLPFRGVLPEAVWSTCKCFISFIVHASAVVLMAVSTAIPGSSRVGLQSSASSVLLEGHAWTVAVDMSSGRPTQCLLPARSGLAAGCCTLRLWPQATAHEPVLPTAAYQGLSSSSATDSRSESSRPLWSQEGKLPSHLQARCCCASMPQGS